MTRNVVECVKQLGRWTRNKLVSVAAYVVKSIVYPWGRRTEKNLVLIAVCVVQIGVHPLGLIGLSGQQAPLTGHLQESPLNAGQIKNVRLCVIMGKRTRFGKGGEKVIVEGVIDVAELIVKIWICNFPKIL